MGFWKNLFGVSSELETENHVSENLKDNCQSETNVYIIKSLAEAIASSWNNMNAEMLAPYLIDDMQYNSVWISNTIMGKADYLHYLREKFETIKNSKDIPVH